MKSPSQGQYKKLACDIYELNFRLSSVLVFDLAKNGKRSLKNKIAANISYTQ